VLVAPQYVVAEYLKSGHYDKLIHSVRGQYNVQMHQVLQKIQEAFPEDIRVTQPSGGFIIWLELPKHVDTVKLLEESLKQGVSFTPGVLFSPKDRYNNCLRLNSAKNWNETWDDALKKLGQLAQKAIDTDS